MHRFSTLVIAAVVMNDDDNDNALKAGNPNCITGSADGQFKKVSFSR